MDTNKLPSTIRANDGLSTGDGQQGEDVAGELQVITKKAGEQGLNDLLPAGYCVQTGLYHEVVKELPLLGFSGGEIGLDPIAQSGGDAVADEGDEHGEPRLMQAMGMTEGVDGLERTHAED